MIRTADIPLPGNELLPVNCQVWYFIVFSHTHFFYFLPLFLLRRHYTLSSSCFIVIILFIIILFIIILFSSSCFVIFLPFHHHALSSLYFFIIMLCRHHAFIIQIRRFIHLIWMILISRFKRIFYISCLKIPALRSFSISASSSIGNTSSIFFSVISGLSLIRWYACSAHSFSLFLHTSPKSAFNVSNRIILDPLIRLFRALFLSHFCILAPSPLSTYRTGLSLIS